MRPERCRSAVVPVLSRMPAGQSHEILRVACCYNIALPWRQAKFHWLDKEKEAGPGEREEGSGASERGEDPYIRG
ncbi:hypothetical protein KM043_016955 [Ampulex compressa]|nr:hypothetical protein KM043_016955 [Ampulex compressa]